jgi:hypothetical protein
VTISFAKPFQTPAGVLDVPEEDKVKRTITIDRTRKINFILEKPTEANSIPDENDETQTK